MLALLPFGSMAASGSSSFSATDAVSGLLQKALSGTPMQNSLAILGTASAGLLAVLLLRTFGGKGPRAKEPERDALAEAFLARKMEIAESLSKALQLKTVSYDKEDGGEKKHTHKPICAAIHDHSKAGCSDKDKAAGSTSSTGGMSTGTVSMSAEELRSKVEVTRQELLKLHEHLRVTYPLIHGTAAAGGSAEGKAGRAASVSKRERSRSIDGCAAASSSSSSTGAALERHVINELSLCYIWRGSDPSLPAAGFYSHMDVVPADDAELWSIPPFSGAIQDGYVWGRGAIDDKQAVIATMEAVEHLLRTGFKPRRTIVLLFGHDEEIGGWEGAKLLGEWVKENLKLAPGKDGRVASGKPLAFLLDEGLFILEGVIPGLKSHRSALICTAEKGFMNVKLEVTVTGGHASTPPADTAIGILSRAIAKLEANPFPSRLNDGPVTGMFQTFLPYLPLALRVLFSNLWLFRGLLAWVMSLAPKTATMVRTTTAPTIVKGGFKANTLPATATAIINHRIHPEESSASVLARDIAVINDPRVKVTELGTSVEPSPVSSTENGSFKLLGSAVEGLFDRVIAAPALMIGATDSHWNEDIASSIYRHCPTELQAHEVSMFHGLNERIAVDNLARASAFYARVMLQADAAEQL